MGKAARKKKVAGSNIRSQKGGVREELELPKEKLTDSLQKTTLIIRVIPILIILFVSFAVYFNTLYNEFVYDDSSQVLKNYLIRDIRNIPQIFSRSVWAFPSAPIISNYYRPVMNIIYMVNYYIFGLKPWGFHLVNILFHAATTVMVFLITARLFKEANSTSMPSPFLISPPFIAALLFATHPIHTEAVTWVAGIPDISYAFFYLLSFYFYMRSKAGLKSGYPISIAMFLFSCFSKEPALTLPLILIGYDYLFNKSGEHFFDRWKRYIPYLFVVGVYFALRLHALGGLAPEKRHEYLSNYQYIINVFPLFSRYLEKLILPINLNAFYVFHPIVSLFETIGILSVAVTVIYIVIAAITYKENRVACFFLLIIVVPLLPVFYIQSLGSNAFTERYLYLPSVGFVALLAMILTKLAGKNPKGAMVLVSSLTLLIGLYSLGTIKRNAIWKSDYTLFEDTVRKSPDSAIAHEKFATALMEGNQLDEAIRHYRVALNLDYYYDDTHTNLGIAFYRKGLIDQAIEEERISIKLYPNEPEKHFNLAQQLADKQLWPEATQEYEIAVKLDPNFADAHNSLGFSYAMVGSIDKAIEHFDTARRLAPDNPMYQKNLSRAYKMKEESLEKEKNR